MGGWPGGDVPGAGDPGDVAGRRVRVVWAPVETLVTGDTRSASPRLPGSPGQHRSSDSSARSSGSSEKALQGPPHATCRVAAGRGLSGQSARSRVAGPGPLLVAALERGCGRISEPGDRQPSPGPRDSLCLGGEEVPVLTLKMEG